MTAPVATYSFLPWLRQGISGKIVSADFDPAVKLRARVPVGLDIGAQGIDGAPLTAPINRNVDLYGPGDIIGIESRAIVRMEPVASPVVTNFEANYLPAIEFYDEDFPWRYTPAAPNGDRLRPWIALVVLADGEFIDGKDITNKPLPYITVADRAVFPAATQLAAWAHVHVNQSLAANATELVSTDMAAVLPKLQAALAADADIACSRILCPRRLAPNTSYTAFLIPVFESGRLAGLGVDPAKTPYATHGAWDDYPAGAATREAPNDYPFYFSWNFRTAAIGDFEYLVRLLQAKPVDKRVGTRDIDVQRPGLNLPGVTAAGMNGVLKLGGALRVPRASLSPTDQADVVRDEAWATPYPQPMQRALASVINLSNDYATQTAASANAAAMSEVAANTPGGPGGAAIPVSADPMITPPLYGRWHALTNRLLVDAAGANVPNRTNWIHELNLDPRFRAAAGIGTKLVRKDQENYMNMAWAQIGDVLAAIQRMRVAELAKHTSKSWHDRHLMTVHGENMEHGFGIVAPVQNRVVAQDLTVQYQVSQSPLSSAATSVAMRRVTRPGGRIMKRVTFSGDAKPGNLLARINAGDVAAAPPKVAPSGVNTVGEVIEAMLPKSPVAGLLRRYAWLPFAILILGAIIALLLWLLVPSPTGPALAAAVMAVAIAIFQWLRRLRRQIDRAERLSPEGQRPEAVASLPVAPTFLVEVPRGAPPGTPPPANPGVDSAEARRFKEALAGAYSLLGDSATVSVEEPHRPVDLELLATTTMVAIDPATTVPTRMMAGISIPQHIAVEQVEEFQEPMFYPEINTPMYKPLYELSAELFIPNVNLIPENSITLLESNQKFIEAYMVGLNVEFGRELLWREYPSDNRGSYFRQFWDVSGFLSGGNANDPVLREKLKDIPPLHLWSRGSSLGSHDHRGDRTAAQNDAVLVIRGELLKRYPRAAIYAQRAAWVPKANGGGIDTSVPRTLVEVTDAEVNAANPPRAKLRTPLYAAKIEPDIYFLGFDLTIDEATGGTGEQPTDDPGWFFVMKERPGEPRFGLDVLRSGALNAWENVAWTDVLPAGAGPGSYIDIATAPPPLTEPANGPLHDQWQEDSAVSWSTNVSSADLAYILFRPPVLVGIHAAELLQRR